MAYPTISKPMRDRTKLEYALPSIIKLKLVKLGYLAAKR